MPIVIKPTGKATRHANANCHEVINIAINIPTNISIPWNKVNTDNVMFSSTFAVSFVI
jgi:hypothetical protein